MSYKTIYGSKETVEVVTDTDPNSPNYAHVYHINHGTGNQNICFQNGTVLEVGHNGVTNEALLAITIHRTKILNDKFPCDENEQAIGHMEAALKCFEDRTANRVARNVEGQHVV